jgi:hypothetical protein
MSSEMVRLTRRCRYLSQRLHRLNLFQVANDGRISLVREHLEEAYKMRTRLESDFPHYTCGDSGNKRELSKLRDEIASQGRRPTTEDK